MTRSSVALLLACASVGLFACQPIAIAPVASSSPGITPLASKTPVPALGQALDFHYLGSATVRLLDGEGPATISTARIRKQEDWQRALGADEGIERLVDFRRQEVLAVVDPLHACVGWPDQQGVRYERGFWLVDAGDVVRFSVHVSAATGRYGLLCRPAMQMAFYRIPRLGKPIEDGRGEAVPTWPVVAEAAASPAGPVLESALLGAYSFKDFDPSPLKATTHVRSAGALGALFAGLTEDPPPAVDFERYEVLVAQDPYHACLGWPSGVKYERNFVLEDAGSERRFTLEARVASQRRVLCDPAPPGFLVYRVNRSEKPIAGAEAFVESEASE